MNEGWYFYRKQQWFLCLCLCSEQGLVGLSEKVHICVCSVAHSCLTLVTPSTVAFQAPLSMGFPRQDYWSGLPCPPPSRPSDGTCIGRRVLYHLTTWEGPVRRVVAVVQWLCWVRLFVTLWTEVQPHFPVLHYLLEFAQTPALSQ